MAATISVLADKGKSGLTGAMKINIGGHYRSSYLSYGAKKITTIGNPAPPSLQVIYPTSFRFRWVVRSGTHSIQVNCLQATNLSPRPQLIVRANPSISINNDLSASAPSSTGWVVIGPIVLTATSTGIVYVDLVSNTTQENDGTTYFDHIVTT